MDSNLLIGCIVGAGALGLITYLVLWSRRTIDRIAGRGFGSAREIRKDMQSDR